MERKSLYRYSAKKWNDALIERGSVRIGTLRDFRNIEHKPGISDPFEGTKTLQHEIDDWQFGNEIPGAPSYHARTAELMGLIQDPPNRKGQIIDGSIQGISILLPVDDPNCFIHCTSYRLRKDVMSQFEGADSCVEIYNIQGFYECLTNAINKHVPVRWGGLQDVHYASRWEICNGQNLGISPTWLKGDDFSPQYEARAVWHPVDPGKSIDWFAIEIPELSKFCRKIKIK